MKWSDILSKDMLDLSSSLEERALREREDGHPICPAQENIFRALTLTNPEDVKVCIVGQDPYHTPGQANGLAFSVSPGSQLQPSLKNIFKELQNDLACGSPPNGDLTPWAERGVLLLNTSLTVYEHQPNSHVNWGWSKFTGAVLQAAARLPQPLVFMLWGANAQDLFSKITPPSPIVFEDNVARQNMIKKAYILSSHPSPFSVTKPYRNTPPFRGSRPFSKANKLLEEFGGNPVDWTLL